MMVIAPNELIASEQKTLEHSPITTRIVKAISLIHKAGRDCVAIYLGDKYRWELEKFSGGPIRKFYGLPVYFVVEPTDHFFISSGWKEPMQPPVKVDHPPIAALNIKGWKG